jgi:hypothetical protein
MKIEPGMEIIVTGVEWREDWEFDHPTVLLTPVRRYSPYGDSPEQMVESLAIDAAVDGEIKDHDDAAEFEWRGWSWKRLAAVYRRCFAGANFPRKQYQAFRAVVRFVTDGDGELEARIGEIEYSHAEASKATR